MLTQIPQSWQALAKADTPELLHTASLQVEMGSWYTWTGPWLVFPLAMNDHAPKDLSVLPPLKVFRFLSRRIPDGEITGHIDLHLYRGTPDPTAIYRHTFLTGQSVITYPTGLAHAGLLIPGADPSRQVDAGPDALADVLGAVACLSYMDQFQVLALRSLNPVEIPGFPKLVSSGGLSFKGRNVF